MQPSAEHPADPALNKPRRVAAEGINPFPQWDEVVRLLQEKDPMLYTYLKKSKGYFDGTRVHIDGGKTFRDFIRANKGAAVEKDSAASGIALGFVQCVPYRISVK